MRPFHKTTLATVIGFGLFAFASVPALAAADSTAGTAAAKPPAHMGGGQGGQPCPAGTAGGGMMGQGMMGRMGSGMMGRGMMGQGMMGAGTRVTPVQDLTIDDVRHFLDHRIRMHDNKRLKVGEVKKVDEDTIIADIVTQDDSLVRRYKVDRHTGQMKSAE